MSGRVLELELVPVREPAERDALVLVHGLVRHDVHERLDVVPAAWDGA